MYSVLIEIKVLIWWILQAKDYMLLGCNEILLFGFRAIALLLITTTLNYSEITSLVVLEDAFSLLVSFYSSLPSKCWVFIPKYSIDACIKGFPSRFCPVWQQLRLWFINTVNLALRLLVLDPKCHRQVMQSADSIQTDSHRSNLFENLLIDYSIIFSAESGVVRTPTAAVKLA